MKTTQMRRVRLGGGQIIQRTGVVVAVMVLMTACQQVPDKLPQKGIAVPPPDKSVFIRASFDNDPSSYIGRFLPDAITIEQMDENQAMATRCSKFISFKEIDAQGTYDEYYSSAAQAGLSIGAPGVGDIGGEIGQTATVRVKYELHKKMRAEIKDQEAFDQCCSAAPDQCPDFIIGEFYQGTGSMFQAVGASAGADLGGSQGGVSGELDLKDEVVWKRQTSFERVYFAFRKQRVRSNPVAATDPNDCSWASSVPSSLDGKFFVGISSPVASEAQARDYAMRNARTQVVKYIGEVIGTASSTTTHAIDGYLQDESIVTAVAEGLVSRVKDRRWCPAQTTETPKGLMYSVKVLAFFPEADEKAAARETVQNLQKALESRGELDENTKATLKKTLEGLN